MSRLRTFVIVQNGTIISPILTTIREYGKWLEGEYNDYICNFELYLKATVDGKQLLEYHPGTRIGQYFDKTDFRDSKFMSWYILQDSEMMNKLRDWKMAEYRDAIPISVTDEKARRMLRVYSLNQIELYVRTKIDVDFKLKDSHYLKPKQLRIRKFDMSKIIIPKTVKKKNTLFDNESKPVQMTMEEIEEQLGHKVSIVS